MTCRNCRYLDVRPDKDGKRRTRKSNSYRCTAPMPKVKWPDSVTTYHGYHFPPHKTMMSPDQGEDCPTFKEPEASTELSHSTWGWP